MVPFAIKKDKTNKMETVCTTTEYVVFKTNVLQKTFY